MTGGVGEQLAEEWRWLLQVQRSQLLPTGLSKSVSGACALGRPKLLAIAVQAQVFKSLLEAPCRQAFGSVGSASQCHFSPWRRLTLRSSGPPPAWHLCREASQVIVRLAAQAPSRWRPLSSNVRRRRTPTVSPSLESMNPDSRFKEAAASLGYSFDGDIRVGGNYVSIIRDGNVLYVSGQVPRVGSEVVVVGRVGEQVSLAQAQLAAKVCALRALALLQRELGTLANLRQVLRVTVFTQSSAEFTQQSEVADGASELLHFVLGEAGKHTRTSVGVYQLPKNASVELDLVASVTG
jgi:enamine deaminase RidA (YjgF/YER057c/UK114 family)